MYHLTNGSTEKVFIIIITIWLFYHFLCLSSYLGLSFLTCKMGGPDFLSKALFPSYILHFVLGIFLSGGSRSLRMSKPGTWGMVVGKPMKWGDDDILGLRDHHVCREGA